MEPIHNTQYMWKQIYHSVYKYISLENISLENISLENISLENISLAHVHVFPIYVWQYSLVSVTLW